MPDPRFEPVSTNPFGLTKAGLFAKPIFVDIDKDGDLDAFVGSGGDSNNPGTQDGDTLFYQNTGNASNPAFAAATVNPFGLTNVGGIGDAAPTFVDIDADGDLDAFIGNGNGNTLFYRNTGNASNPAFAAATVNPFGLTDVGTNAAPTFIDIDGDGDLDAFVGELSQNNGGLLFFENKGSPSAPTFASRISQPFGLTVSVRNTVVTFVDIDGDGDWDACVGNLQGNILIYQNTGSASSPKFSTPSTNPFVGLTNVGNNAAPTFVDIDGDGDSDVLVGNRDGNILFFRNTPSVAIAPTNASQTEGNTGTKAFTFTVTRTGDTSGKSTANWEVTGFGANSVDATDFGGTLPSGTVTFNPTETSKVITVNVSGDSTFESDEAFTVTLSNPTNATITTATATGTIINDDTALAIAPSNISQTEGNTETKAFTFTIRREGNTTGTSSVNWEVTGFGSNSVDATDFGGTLPSGTVTFNPTETSKVITVNVSGDSTFESDEAFTVTLSNPTNATITTATATGTIINDDTALVIVPTNISQAEGNTGIKAFTFTITRIGDTSAISSANWEVTGFGDNPADATDFGETFPSGTVDFANGETSKDITFTVSGDTIGEFDEGFAVTLSNPTNATIISATVTGSIINDDAALAIAPTNISQTEGNTGTTAFTFTISRTGDTTDTSSVNWEVIGLWDNPADATDFGGTLPLGTVDFANGETSKDITFTVSGDTIGEFDEGFAVTLSNPTNATIISATATGTIINDDIALAIAPTNISQAEGNTGTTAFTFTVTRTGDTSGTSSANWKVTAFGTDPDAGDFGGTLPWGTVDFANGETSKDITINVSGDTIGEFDEGFAVTLSNPTNATIISATATGTIINDDPALAIDGTNGRNWGIVIKPEGNTETTAFTFTIKRTGDTTVTSAVNWTVTGSGTNPADATDFGGTFPSGTVDFANGETEKDITINVLGDTIGEFEEEFTVTLSNPTNATIISATVTGSIINDDAALAIAPTNISQTEGNTGTKAFTFTVNRSGNTSGISSVNWKVTGLGSNPADATDFGGTFPSGTVDFANGETEKDITVNVSGDSTVEPNEEFAITLSNPTNATIISATATGTIQNDDIVSGSPPLITGSNSATVLENSPISTVVYTATATDPDGPTNQIVWSLEGTNANAFTINNNGQVRFKAVPDYETQSGYSINVIATDSSQLSTAKTVTIEVIDQAVFSINNVTVNESEGHAIFIVTATDPISNGTSTATVNYATANITAFGSNNSNGDYGRTNDSLSFSTGDNSKTVSIVINDDTLYEPTPETFTVRLRNPTNGAIANATGTGTIVDNDPPPTISVQNSQVVEDNSGTVQLIFSVNLSVLSGQEVRVNYTVSDGTATVADNDYVSTSGTLRIGAGMLSGTIAITVNGETTVESDETLTLNLSNAVGAIIAQGTATGKIVNDDGINGAITLTGTTESDTLSSNPTATTVPDEIFRGLLGDDILLGYHGNNIFEGGAGADILTGYAGKDIFVYPSLSDSALNAMDTITRFNSTEGDRVQLLSLPSKLSYVGEIIASNLSEATTQAYTTANLGANEALFFKYGSPYYLSVNNGTPAFTDTDDLLIRFGSLLDAPTTAGLLTVNSYFQTGT